MKITNDMLETQRRAESEAINRGHTARVVAQAGLDAVAPLIIAAHEQERAERLQQHGWSLPEICPDPSRHAPSRSVGGLGLAQAWRSEALQAVCSAYADPNASNRTGGQLNAHWSIVLDRAEEAACWIATGERS